VDQDAGAVLSDETFIVPAGSYGPFETYPFPGYEFASWSMAPDSSPASGTIYPDETITVIFLYSLE